MSISRRHALCGILLGAAALASGAAFADKREQDLDAIRIAVEKGEIRPLAEIVAGIRNKLPGDIVGTEVERKDGRWIYEFRVVDSKGRLYEAYVDAKSGDLDRIKEK
jgi:uncharacterized membrane protein YkoI